jgi:hypothetical protein
VRFAAPVLLILALSAVVEAAEAPRLDDAQWTVTSKGPLAVDAGLLMGPPLTLSTGLSTGVGGGLTVGRRLAWGVRASWSTATESSLVWTVTQQAFRLRAVAAVQQPVGRGAFGLRLGLGPTFVYEDRIRNQGSRAHLTGSDLETSALVALPAGELEAVVSVHVAGRWLMTLSGGPSALLSDGALVRGWTAQLGAGWQP